jgi:hypothetical protein
MVLIPGETKMRTLLLGVAVAMLAGVPAIAQAQTCQQHISAFDKAVMATKAEAEKVEAAKKLRADGAEKLKAGDETGCVADLAKASEMIGVMTK